MRRREGFVWHSWLGLTAGLMLFVICWSGTFAVLSYEIDWLLNPDLQANVIDGVVPFVEAYDAVTQAYPHWKIREINAPRYPGFAMEVLARIEAGIQQRVYVDPVTLEVLGDTSYLNVQRFFRSFHMALIQIDVFSVFGIPLGYFIVVIFAFPLLVSMVTPLIFYKRWWRGFFKLSTGKGTRIFWSDVHKLTGLWSLWFVTLICLTSFWYLAEWFIPYPPEPKTPELTVTEALSLETLIGNARESFPQLEIKSISFFAADNHLLYLSGDDGTALTRGNAHVALDLRTGESVQIYHQGRSGLIARLMETVDVLHFGTFAGLWSQFLYFVFGLLLSGLTLTGAYLQAKRQTRRHRVHGLRKPVLIAYIVTIILLLMASAAGWAEITAYDVNGGWPKTNPLAVGFVLVWILSTIAILSAWMLKLR